MKNDLTSCTQTIVIDQELGIYSNSAVSGKPKHVSTVAYYEGKIGHNMNKYNHETKFSRTDRRTIHGWPSNPTQSPWRKLVSQNREGCKLSQAISYHALCVCHTINSSCCLGSIGSLMILLNRLTAQKHINLKKDSGSVQRSTDRDSMRSLWSWVRSKSSIRRISSDLLVPKAIPSCLDWMLFWGLDTLISEIEGSIFKALRLSSTLSWHREHCLKNTCWIDLRGLECGLEGFRKALIKACWHESRSNQALHHVTPNDRVWDCDSLWEERSGGGVIVGKLRSENSAST